MTVLSCSIQHGTIAFVCLSLLLCARHPDHHLAVVVLVKCIEHLLLSSCCFAVKVNYITDRVNETSQHRMRAVYHFHRAQTQRLPSHRCFHPLWARVLVIGHRLRDLNRKAGFIANLPDQLRTSNSERTPNFLSGMHALTLEFHRLVNWWGRCKGNVFEVG